MDKEQLKERFLNLLSSVDREGIPELIEWISNTDFFEAPASTRFHGAYEGGLVEHSLNVYDQFLKLNSAYPEFEFNKDSVIICTLLHDLCKANMYGSEMRNRKNADGKWEQYAAYTRAEKFNFGGHGSKSVFLIQHFVKLTPEEGVAINCHMGSWDGNLSTGDAFEQFPIAWFVHAADEAATYFVEGKK